VQTASNARSHGHHDSGSFIVFHDGAPVFIDPGVEAYTAKTFSAERYSIWTMQSGYHNLPIVAGRMQQGGQAGYRASRVKVEDSEAATSMTMDLATAYGPDAGIGNWERTVALQRVAGAGAVSVREAFRLARPALVTLVFMTPRLPEPAGAGRLALGSPQGGGKAVHMRYDALSMGADIERIALTDAGLRREWGEAIYRIRLTTLQPVRQGSLSILVE
jgi:hypothetical protein